MQDDIALAVSFSFSSGSDAVPSFLLLTLVQPIESKYCCKELNLIFRLLSLALIDIVVFIGI